MSLVDEPQEDRLIDTDVMEDQFYEQLVEGMDECYRVAACCPSRRPEAWSRT